MDIFKSDKAPYVLALLVSVIGWHVSQLVNEITTTQAVSYDVRVDRQSREVSATVRNISRTRSLVDASFSLECASGQNCFVPIHPAEEGSDPIFGRIDAFSPNGLSRTTREDSAASIVFTNTVAAGGRYRIVGRLADPNSRVNFYYLPNADSRQRPLDIYLYERGSIGAFVVENYLTLLSISLFLCIVALIYSLVRRPRPVTQTDAEPAKEASNGP